MKFTFLGTGTSSGVPVPTCECRVCRSSDPRDRRLRPSVLLAWDDASVLLDTSTDLREQALRYGIGRVDAVLYTHAHADHVLGLDDLRIYNWRQRGPIPLYGSASTLEALSRTFWYVFDEEPGESTRPIVDRRPIDGPFTLHARQVVPIPLMHGRLPVLGYRLGRFAYLTDVSRIPEASYELLERLDILVLSALRERPHPTHLNLDGAIELARRIGAAATWFTHMSHEVHHASVSAELPEGIDLAWDGLQLDVADEESV